MMETICYHFHRKLAMKIFLSTIMLLFTNFLVVVLNLLMKVQVKKE